MILRRFFKWRAKKSVEFVFLYVLKSKSSGKRFDLPLRVDK